MKSQLEEVLDAIDVAVKYFEHFSAEEIEKEPRIRRLRDLLQAASRVLPKHSLSSLVIEYDQATGKPKLNEESVQSYLRWQVEKAIAEAEPNTELDLLDSTRDDDLIARMNGAYEFPKGHFVWGDDTKEARFLLEMRIEMYRESANNIERALRPPP